MEIRESTLITNARLFCPTAGLDSPGAIEIRDGRIVGIHLSEDPEAETEHVCDAEGRLVMPGFTELHAQSGEPGHEYRESLAQLSAAALRGGFTSICLMANTDPVNDCRTVTEYLTRRGQEINGAHLLPVGALTMGLSGDRLTEMFDLRSGGAIAFGDGLRARAQGGLMRRAMEYASATGRPVFDFPFNASLGGQGVMHEGLSSTRLGLKGVPVAAEEARVGRAIALVRQTGSPLHLGPISAKVSVEGVRRAKADGLPVTASVTINHLVFIDESIESDWSTSLKVLPVLRSEIDRQALLEGVNDGTIDAISSGHSAQGAVDKSVPFAQAEFGARGLQTTLGAGLRLVAEGSLNERSFFRALTTGPADCIRLTPGRLAVGESADLVEIDMHAETLYSAEQLVGPAKNSPFIDCSLPGRVCRTWVDGHLKYEGTIEEGNAE